MKGKRPDFYLIGTAAILIILGILILASVSADLAYKIYGDASYLLNHQLLYGFLPGIFCALVGYKLKIEQIKKFAPLLLLVNLILLALVFIPQIGGEFRGATRWINIGPVSFQPSEFLKLTFILYLAAWLSSRLDKSKKTEGFLGNTFLPFIMALAIISLFLILQPDLSTLGVIAVSAFCLYFLAETPLWQSILMGAGGLTVLAILVKIAPYRLERFLIFLNPDSDPLGKGYQINQALISVGSGGFAGMGLGSSAQQAGYLPPQAFSDSIFAAFSQEVGFIGGLILIIIFLFLAFRGVKIGMETQDKFSRYAAFGITGWLTIQALANIASMLAIVPVTGIPLPFLSFGGSALIAELTALGILANISKYT